MVLRFFITAVLLFSMAFFVLGCSSSGTEGEAEVQEHGHEEGVPEDHPHDESGEVIKEEGDEHDGDAKELPEINIIQPEDGSDITAGVIGVKVSVENFTLAEKLGEANEPGEGHLHYILDENSPVPSANSSQELEVDAGEHSLVVELHNNDHSALDPPISATIQFTAK